MTKLLSGPENVQSADVHGIRQFEVGKLFAGFYVYVGREAEASGVTS